MNQTRRPPTWTWRLLAPISLVASALATPTFAAGMLPGTAHRATAAAMGVSAPLHEPDASLQSDGLRLELAGHFGGQTRAVAVRGQYAYLGAGPRLLTLKVADAVHPTAIGQSVPLTGVVSDIALAETHAYVTTQNRTVHAVRITNPLAPQDEAYAATGGDAQAVAVSGDVVAVAAGDAGLQLFTLASSTRPAPIGSVAMPGNVRDVALAGGYAYVAAEQGGVHIIRINDPANPVDTGMIATAGQATQVEISDTHLFVTDSGVVEPANRSTGDTRLRLFDITNPAAPRELGSHGVGGAAESLVVAGTAAYVAVSWWNGAGLRIVDVSNPVQPVRAGDYSARWNMRIDLAVAEGRVYAAEEIGHLRVLQVAASATPSDVGSYQIPGTMQAAVIEGGYAYVADAMTGLHVVSLADRAKPQQVSWQALSDEPLQTSMSLAVAGGYAYVTDGNNLYVVSVQNPVRPILLHTVAGVGIAGVAVADGYLYVAGNGFIIFSLEDPGNLKEVGRLDQPPLTMRNLVVRGDYAYVVDTLAGLRIISIGDRAQPREVGRVSFKGPTGVAVAGAYAYVTDLGSRTLTWGLRTIAIADPAQPAEADFLKTPARPFAIAVDGRTAYVANMEAGVRALSLADPAHPAEIGYYNTPGGAANVTTAGGYIYAVGGGGLFILRPTGTAAGPEPTPISPALGSTLPDLSVTLAWQNPPGTTQVEVRMLPYHNDGPGLDMIYGSPRESLTVPAPIMAEGPYLMLPDLGYTWQVRSTTALQALGSESPEWGAWSAPQAFRTPPVVAEGIRPRAPEPGAATVGLQPALTWENQRQDIFYYEVQLSLDPTFETHPVRGTQAVYWNLVHGGETRPLNTWLAPVEFSLEPGRTYYWRVRPRIQGDGTPVTWSPTWSFSTAATGA